MTVLNVTKMWSKTGGGLSSDKMTPFDQIWAITEGYQVLAEIGDTIDVIAAATGIPQIGEQHPSGVDAFVASINPAPLGPLFWVVTVNYNGIIDDAAVDIEWTDTTTTEPIDRDWNGRAIVTFNNEPVDGLSVDVADQVVVIRRKFLTINTAAIAAYRRATNSDTFLNWPPGTARLIGFSAKNSFLYGAPNERWDVTARIQFREPYANTTHAQAWYKRWRHEGLYVRPTAGAFAIRAVDGNQQEMTKPVLLKANGTQETNPDNAVYFHTKVYGSLPYSGLGLT